MLAAEGFVVLYRYVVINALHCISFGQYMKTLLEFKMCSIGRLCVKYGHIQDN